MEPSFTHSLTKFLKACTLLKQDFPYHYVTFDVRCPVIYISRTEKNDPAQLAELEEKAKDITRQTGIPISMQSRS